MASKCPEWSGAEGVLGLESWVFGIYTSTEHTLQTIINHQKCVSRETLEWPNISSTMVSDANTSASRGPHFCEHGWSILGKPGSVLDSRLRWILYRGRKCHNFDRTLAILEIIVFGDSR